LFKLDGECATANLHAVLHVAASILSICIDKFGDKYGNEMTWRETRQPQRRGRVDCSSTAHQ
jgi:hypothetical protein